VELMRIVAGTLRGRPIRAPSGADTRPTSDRARQAIFNILEHAAWSPGLEGLKVADLFAGSGAMGFEALSQGAASCLFVDNSEAALAAVRANIDTFGLKGPARILRQDATRPWIGEPFDLAFLDPPYGKGLGEAALAAGGWLGEGGIAVLERGAAETPADVPGFEVLDERRYGAAAVRLLRRVAG
jgi:16S rRNA (guanine966-N2)-methyltransferase